MCHRFMLTALLLATAPPLAAEERRFSPADMSHWEERRFQAQTHYQLSEVAGETALHARCDGSASGLFLDTGIDLEQTPIIEWRWRIHATFGDGIDETRKAGDDYPARLYVIKDGGWRFWRSRAVNYVWASARAVGDSWPNAYTRNAMMLALRSGDEQAGEWVTERRNLADDFERLHGERPERLDGIAIMTDCDDLQTEAEAWYGTIRLLPE